MLALRFRETVMRTDAFQHEAGKVGALLQHVDGLGAEPLWEPLYVERSSAERTTEQPPQAAIQPAVSLALNQCRPLPRVRP